MSGSALPEWEMSRKVTCRPPGGRFVFPPQPQRPLCVFFVLEEPQPLISDKLQMVSPQCGEKKVMSLLLTTFRLY